MNANFGAPFCRALEPFLANLSALLAEADRVGVTSFDAIVSARAVYEDIDGMVAYIPFIGNDCDRHIAEVKSAIARVTIVLQATPGANLWTPRPDAQPSAEYGVPTWVKYAFFAAAGVAALYYVTPLISPRRKLSAYRRHR